MSIIHDVAYDHYGHRVATCSSDQTIRIYDSAGNKTAEWRAHSGSIWRLSWAHPEFGVALASCSFDRRICIWEENVDAEEAALLLAADNGALPVAQPPAGGKASSSQWMLRKELSDARDSVVDVQFAPHHLDQLLLASCGADGVVRVYEAPDVLDLGSWVPHSDFDAASAAVESAAEVAAAGGGAVGATSGAGFGMGSDAGPTGLSGVGGPSALLPGSAMGAAGGAVSATGAAPGMLGLGGSGGGGGSHSGSVEPLCLAWGTAFAEAPMLVVGMSDGHVLLWMFEEMHKQWVRSRAFGAMRCHSDCVRGVSWASDMGRSYQLIATASRDRTVKLWALHRRVSGDEACVTATSGGGAGGGGGGGGEKGGPGSWTGSCIAELSHRSQVWRVQWNASGSMLATSEDDGSVKIYRQDASGGWRHAEPVGPP